MRLGIDLDGVVADFNGGWTKAYNQQFATELGAEAVTGWNQIPSLTHFENMGEFWHWARGLEGGSLFSRLDPYPGAVEALVGLAGEHDIVVVTTKPSWAEIDTYAWLVEHGVPASEVHITGKKWAVDVDVFLDDAPHVLRYLVERRPDAVVCRYVRPWNHPLAGAVDITDWSDFAAVVEGSG